MSTYETVREIALALPNVEDGLSYGAPALKVGGKELFVRWREELDAIVLKTTFDEREDLMAADPDVYYRPLSELRICACESQNRLPRSPRRYDPPLLYIGYGKEEENLATNARIRKLKIF